MLPVIDLQVMLSTVWSLVPGPSLSGRLLQDLSLSAAMERAHVENIPCPERSTTYYRRSSNSETQAHEAICDARSIRIYARISSCIRVRYVFVPSRQNVQNPDRQSELGSSSTEGPCYIGCNFEVAQAADWTLSSLATCYLCDLACPGDQDQ